MNVVVNNLLVNYSSSGKGKTVVLLHGWGDSAKGLSGPQTDLAKKYHVVALDLPGFGASQAPKEVWDLDDYAKLVAGFLDKLKLGKPYAIIGHSNGGAIAIRGLSLGVLKADKLVLMAAAGIRTGQSLKRLLLKIVAKVGNVATIGLPESQRRRLREQLYGAAGSDMLVAPQLKETFKKTVRQDVQADAANLKLPTLLLYASDDKDVPLADGETYSELIEGSKLTVVDGAGHFLHQDKPAFVTQAIEEFLK